MTDPNEKHDSCIVHSLALEALSHPQCSMDYDPTIENYRGEWYILVRGDGKVGRIFSNFVDEGLKGEVLLEIAAKVLRAEMHTISPPSGK